MIANGTIELYYDPDNKQIDNLWIAEEAPNDENKGKSKEVVGYPVIEKPWYFFENAWRYWLYYNEYEGERNFLKRTVIKPSTLRKYTQTEEIKQHLKLFNVSLKKEMCLYEDEELEDNLVTFIECQTELPKGLWKEIDD